MVKFWLLTDTNLYGSWDTEDELVKMYKRVQKIELDVLLTTKK